MSLSLGVAVPSLARWGLSGDADLVFRTLATFGPRPARGLATELGLPRQRIEAALDELRECGAAIPLDGGTARRPPTWVNQVPARVVDALRARRAHAVDRDAQARRHREIIAAFGGRLAGVGIPLNPALGGTLVGGVRLLRTRSLARRRLAELMAAERHEHLAINTELVFEAESRAAGLPVLRATMARGVRSRTLGRPPVDGDRLAPDRDPDLVDGDAYQLREMPETPLKLTVIDHRTALFPVDPLDFEHGYFEVTAPEVVGRLVELFERGWSDAVDPQLHAIPLIVLSRRERDLVALLAAGHTDTSAARALRISARSVTYQLRAMMDRLGVQNRFQLGLALGALRVAAPPSIT
jgi:DNA-binding CsgD family transcriptional regulator